MTITPKISVIICTHNPRPEYLERVLEALRCQTLPTSEWELLVIDNASEVGLADKWDLSWHPHARHIREDELGLTPARLRGIRESSGELLVFVDDDNLLGPQYLELCKLISIKHPQLGAWGGQVIAEFEEPPSSAVKPFLHLLAIRELTKDRWSNHDDPWGVPCGAGLVCRRSVAEAYYHRTRTSPLGIGLDRKGSSLSSGGDLDLAFTACDLGLGCGLFVNLNVIHLIPTSRLRLDYLLKLSEQIAASGVILHYVRTGQVHSETILQRIMFWLRTLRRSPVIWIGAWHESRGNRQGKKLLTAGSSNTISNIETNNSLSLADTVSEKTR